MPLTATYPFQVNMTLYQACLVLAAYGAQFDEVKFGWGHSTPDVLLTRSSSEERQKSASSIKIIYWKTGTWPSLYSTTKKDRPAGPIWVRGTLRDMVFDRMGLRMKAK